MKRPIVFGIALAAMITLPSVAAKAQRSNEAYYSCISSCIAAAKIYGYAPSAYWSGYTACMLNCEQFNPEAPSGYSSLEKLPMLSPRHNLARDVPAKAQSAS